MSGYLLAAMLIAAGLVRVGSDYWIIAGTALIGSLFLGQVVMNDAMEQSLQSATVFIAALTPIFVTIRLSRVVAARRSTGE